MEHVTISTLVNLVSDHLPISFNCRADQPTSLLALTSILVENSKLAALPP